MRSGFYMVALVLMCLSDKTLSLTLWYIVTWFFVLFAIVDIIEIWKKK